jgi:regulator of protease activity HflC (stomatin/prohibitin superfamily)
MNAILWLVGIAALICLMVPIGIAIAISLVRKHAIDKGLWGVQVPIEEAVIIDHEKGSALILINCPDAVRQTELEKRMKDCPIEVRFVKPGKIFWFGLGLLGRTLHPWWEFPGDEARDRQFRDMPPNFYVPIKDQILTYSAVIWNFGPNATAEMRLERFINEWGVNTRDGIEIYPEISVTIRIVDIYKALFMIDFFLQMIQKTIAAAWKEAVGNLDYYHRADSRDGVEASAEEEEKAHNQDLQRAIQENLRLVLGMGTGDSLDKPEDAEGIVARVLKEYGVLISRLVVTDIDPADPDMQRVFASRATAAIEAQRVVDEAKGEGDAAEHRARGAQALAAAPGLGLAEVLERFMKDGKVSKAEALQLMGDQIKYGSGNRVIFANEGTNLLGAGSALAEGAEAVKASRKESAVSGGQGDEPAAPVEPS